MKSETLRPVSWKVLITQSTSHFRNYHRCTEATASSSWWIVEVALLRTNFNFKLVFDSNCRMIKMLRRISALAKRTVFLNLANGLNYVN